MVTNMIGGSNEMRANVPYAQPKESKSAVLPLFLIGILMLGISAHLFVVIPLQEKPHIVKVFVPVTSSGTALDTALFTAGGETVAVPLRRKPLKLMAYSR
jgi:hypothetical protein